MPAGLTRESIRLDDLIDRSDGVPGVDRVGVSSSLPFSFSPNARLEEEGEVLTDRTLGLSTHYRVIGGDYFQALQIPVRAGRLFDARDKITPRDPIAIGVALTVLPLVALAATWLPARRATRVDPTTALRSE